MKTPGPWSIDKEPDRMEEYIHIVANVIDKGLVVEWDEIAMVTTRGDADLIVKAPQMEQLLKDFLQVYRHADDLGLALLAIADRTVALIGEPDDE